MYKVTIDPGHGGYDPGAVGNGLREKDLTLRISEMVAFGLKQRGFSVLMTRVGDYAPGHLTNTAGELTERVRESDDYGSDLFVSIHINAGGGTGVEVLVCGLGSKAERAARLLLPYLTAAGGWSSRGVKVQNVLVLRETKCPAILTENGFIDTWKDADKLKDDCILWGIAQAHIKGICAFFGMDY